MADLNTLLVTVAGVSTGNPNAWDISKAAYDATPDQGDLSKAFYPGVNLSVAAQNNAMTSLSFSPDGLTLYALGNLASSSVYQYTLVTPWVLTGATYASKSFAVTSQDNVAQGLSFKSDGTKMYIAGAQNDNIYQYSLATAWDVSTASYDSVSFSVSAQDTAPQELWFKPDGTKMYLTGSIGDSVYEYDLSTAWDISSASYVQSFSVASQETIPRGITFLPDGTKMYITGSDGDDVNEYSLSTPWDISTASYTQNFLVSGQTLTPQDVFIKPDGSMFFIMAETNASGVSDSRVFQYGIGGFSVAAQEITPTGLFFKPDGTKMYIIGSAGDDVNEYDLSTAWDITTASYLQNFSVAGQETGPSDLFFKEDGTKMYVVGTTGDDVNEYSLSTGWDVSTASYVQNFSVASQETVPNGIFFKTDGTKMYIVGGNDIVYQYSLSTAWNLSTASYDSVSFSVSAQETNPHSLFFKPDGTKMYVLGQAGDDVNEYDLSTPWDVSSASYVQNLLVLKINPTGLYWRDNGEEFFIVGAVADRVLKYAISST